MTPWVRAVVVVACLAPMTACSFYFGDDDCDSASDDGFEYGHRNPENGECEYWGGGGGGGCYDDGYYDEPTAPPPELDWAYCPSGCEALGEDACLSAPGCRAAYSGTWCPPWADCTEPVQQFIECWGTAPSGPIQGGSCWEQDAQGCSQHDDCSAVYTRDTPTGLLGYLGCQSEGVIDGCYSDAECPDGYVCTAGTECLPPPDCDPTTGACDAVCYGRCVPSMNACEAIECPAGYHCEEECYPCDPVDGDACDPICQATCVPDANTCESVTCGPDQQCVEVCYPCDPYPDGTGCEGGPWCEALCVPIDSCDGVVCAPGSHCEQQCTSDGGGMGECHAVCVPDNVSCEAIDCAPGYHCEESCSTEPCVPGQLCPVPTCTAECVADSSACESIASEPECLARPECVAVYSGDGCLCYPWGCTCENLEFERCEAGAVDPL